MVILSKNGSVSARFLDGFLERFGSLELVEVPLETRVTSCCLLGRTLAKGFARSVIQVEH